MANHIYVPIKEGLLYRCLSGKLPLEDNDFSLKADIDKHLSQQDERRTGGWIHPSSLGECVRKVFYDRIDAHAQDRAGVKAKKMMKFGSLIHEQQQAWAKEIYGAEAFVCEDPMRFEPYRLSFRCDGIFKKKDWLLEIKTVSDSIFKSLKAPREKDLMQAHCYMYVLDVPRVLMYYVNRNNGDDMEFKAYFDPAIWEKVLGIFSEVERCVEEKEVPPRVENTFFCNECKYYGVCTRQKDEKANIAAK